MLKTPVNWLGKYQKACFRPQTNQLCKQKDNLWINDSYYFDILIYHMETASNQRK